MCNIFGGGGDDYTPPPTPAPSVAAPTDSNNVKSQINKGETNTRAKGKKKLIINPTMGTGTGVNL